MTMNYGLKLKELRDNFDLLQKDLGALINVNKDVYGQYERGDAIIPCKHLNTLCNYFNVSFDYILGFTKVKSYSNSSKNIDKIKVGNRLKSWRKNNKITQTQLANLLNTTHSVIADYERGRYLIATPFLYTLCKTYNISADYLLGKID